MSISQHMLIDASLVCVHVDFQKEYVNVNG